MKTKTRVLRDYPERKTLINAVISRVGMESVQDIINHGIDGGFNGFIYYTDTVRFFNRHRKGIMSMAEDMARELGEGLLEMIQGFGCLGEDYSQDEIAKALYSGRGEKVTQIKNAMAWFAAEEVCRMFDN